MQIARFILVGGGLGLAALAVACGVPTVGYSAAVAQSPSPDGLYTEAQAEMGHTLFNERCSACHLTSEFAGAVFGRNWSGMGVDDFLSFNRLTMPYRDPGSLEDEEYAAVVAYILSLRGYPVGDTPLPADPAALAGVRFSSP